MLDAGNTDRAHPKRSNIMFVVGLTGGIGSGKSAAAKVFTELGVSVIDADQVARDVVEPGSPVLTDIVTHFGASILRPDTSLDRAKLRKIVFADDKERLWLESVTHPAIGQTIIERLSQPRGEREPPYRVMESPLLMETTQKSLADRLLLIDVSESLQVQRTVQRDNNTEQQVRAIIAAQMPRASKRALADDIVDNSGSEAQLADAIRQLHPRYCKLAETFSCGSS